MADALYAAVCALGANGMIDLKQMSRAELESFYDVAHDDYQAVCKQNESLKKEIERLRKEVEQLREERNRWGGRAQEAEAQLAKAREALVYIIEVTTAGQTEPLRERARQTLKELGE